MGNRGSHRRLSDGDYQQQWICQIQGAAMLATPFYFALATTRRQSTGPGLSRDGSGSRTFMEREC